MKKIVCIIIILISSTITYAENGVYFVDADSLLNNSEYGKKIVNKLKNINSKNISDLEKDEKELKKIEDEINKIKNIITEEELNKKISDLKDKIIIYRKKKILNLKNTTTIKTKN